MRAAGSAGSCDDYPAIVRYFGGYFIPEFYFSDDDDNELESVYQVISEFASLGRADHHRWRPRLMETAQ